MKIINESREKMSLHVFFRLVFSTGLSASVNDLDLPLSDVLLSLVNVLSRLVRSFSDTERTRWMDPPAVRFRGDALAAS